jgi:HAMP domain-containing protein
MNLGIKSKTLLPLLLILTIAMGGLAIFNYFSQVALLNSEAEDTLAQTLNSAQSLINDRLQQYQQLATLVVEMPTIADAFAKGDRKKLVTEFSPGFELLKKNFKVDVFSFHTPPATNFVRLHAIAQFGDDNAPFRHTIVYVNEKKTGTKGIEVGRRGLYLRGMMPIFTKGKHIGSVEFGGDLTPAIDETKHVFAVETGAVLSSEVMGLVWPEWQQNVKPIGNYMPFYSTNQQLTEGLITPTRLAAMKAKGGGMYMDTGFIAGRNYYIAASALKDFSGNDIGYLYIFKDQTELLNELRRVLTVNVAIYVSILLAISLAINFSLNKTVINPVLMLTKAADEVSMGKLSEKIAVETNDEIATLAKSIDRMRASMKKLLE